MALTFDQFNAQSQHWRSESFSILTAMVKYSLIALKWRTLHFAPAVEKLPFKLLILDPVRVHRIFAKSALLVFLVILEVAFEPLDM
jgi:hypothetical protein